jgi:hypothetical protein
MVGPIVRHVRGLSIDMSIDKQSYHLYCFHQVLARGRFATLLADKEETMDWPIIAIALLPGLLALVLNSFRLWIENRRLLDRVARRRWLERGLPEWYEEDAWSCPEFRASEAADIPWGLAVLFWVIVIVLMAQPHV